MGTRNTFSLLIIFCFFESCGNFIGFKPPKQADIEPLDSFTLFISAEAKQSLFESVGTSEFTRVSFQDNRLNSFQGRFLNIRVRGNSSRIAPKKSYTVEVEKPKVKRYALDAGGDTWFGYGLAMYAYALGGLPAPAFEPVGLYKNDRLEGFYNIFPLYDSSLNSEKIYNDKEGELYKISFDPEGEEMNPEYRSEKKFPKNDDFSSFDALFINLDNMNHLEWVRYIETPGIAAFKDIATYMAVRDFLGIADTYQVNWYIYFCKTGFRILPWDSDSGFAYTPLGGNSDLTKRMMESDIFRDIYYQRVKDLFYDNKSKDYILKNLQLKLDQDYKKINKIALVDPYFSYSSFTGEYKNLSVFLKDRPNQLRENDSTLDSLLR